MANEELRKRAVDNYLEVMGHTEEEVEATNDIGYLGDYGEYIIIENDAPKVTKIHYRVYIDGEPHIIDIVEEDRVVESKYWPSKKSYKDRFEIPQAFTELVNELKACKYVMEQEGLKKVCLVFVKKVLDDDTFNNYMQKLRDALGVDTGWLVICNGFEEYKLKYP